MFRVHTPFIRSIRCWVAAYDFLHRVFGWVVVLRAAAWVVCTVRMVPCTIRTVHTTSRFLQNVGITNNAVLTSDRIIFRFDKLYCSATKFIDLVASSWHFTLFQYWNKLILAFKGWRPCGLQYSSSDCEQHASYRKCSGKPYGLICMGTSWLYWAISSFSKDFWSVLLLVLFFVSDT